MGDDNVRVSEIAAGLRRVVVGEGAHAGVYAPNVYLVVGDDGAVFVDTAYGTDAEVGAHLDVWRAAGSPPVLAIVLTHRHGDHVGGAARLRAATGGRVVCGPAECDAIETEAVSGQVEGEPYQRVVGNGGNGDAGSGGVSGDGDGGSAVGGDAGLGGVSGDGDGGGGSAVGGDGDGGVGGSAGGISVDGTVGDGDVLDLGGVTLEFVETPGHTVGSVCVVYRETGTLFSGDMILGTGTTVISPEHGDMAAYIGSMRKLAGIEGLRMIAPGHGPVIETPYEKFRELVEHRLAREEQIVGLVAGGCDSVDALLDAIYAGNIHPGLMETARSQIRAHLVKLEAEGRVSGVL